MYMIKEKVSEGLSRLFADSHNHASSSSFGNSRSDPSKARQYSPEEKPFSSYLSYIGLGSKKVKQDTKLYQPLSVSSSDKNLGKNEDVYSLQGDSPPYKSYETPKCQFPSILEIRKSVDNKEEVDDTGSGKSTSSSDVFEEAAEQNSPVKHLQNLMDVSAFISPELYEFLHSSLPNLVKGQQWVLLYSTAKHGISLQTLIRKTSEVSGPCLLIAGDMQGAVFGGLLDCPLKPTPKRKYQGTNQTFVFTTLHGEPRLFRATGTNRYYYICMNDLLAFGGGGNFALCVDSDLLTATSGPCETFGSLCLAHNPEFELKNIEVWGFAHISDYLT
ncbi:hypothetical protein SAY86_025525 [Trapa natans]|uniref:TLDc domain-containing protein n=1 Tax=Trapa natans TaxID=22666 RepID=A0AAN7M6I7_TRANT|nr:hypothetical protein SAY86_025525 [Trapa natans]